MHEANGSAMASSTQISSTSTMPTITQAVERLIESLDWPTRAAKIDPLILIWTRGMIRRFQRQLRYFVRHGLPTVAEYATVQEASPARVTSESAIAAALTSLDQFEFAMPALDRAIRRAIVAGAQAAQDDTVIASSITLKSDPVLEYLKNRSLAKIGKDVDAVTRERIRAILVQGFEEKWTYAKTVRSVKALYSGFTARAPQKHIANRAELIANTEMGNAFSHGTLEFARDLERRGTVMEKSWGLAYSPCPICIANADEGWIETDQSFSSGDSAPLAHPACKCSLVVRVVPVKQ